LWTVGQGLITRRLVPKTLAPALEKKSSRTPRSDDGGSGGDGAKSASAKPQASASPVAPRKVRRKKKAGGRR